MMMRLLVLKQSTFDSSDKEPSSVDELVTVPCSLVYTKPQFGGDAGVRLKEKLERSNGNGGW